MVFGSYRVSVESYDSELRSMNNRGPVCTHRLACGCRAGSAHPTLWGSLARIVEHCCRLGTVGVASARAGTQRWPLCLPWCTVRAG